MTHYARVRLADETMHYARLEARRGNAFDTACLLARAPWLGVEEIGQHVMLAQTRFDVPVEPSKIIGVGRNYREHAAELNNPVPERPLLFFKPPSSLLAHGGMLDLPPESQRVDHEAELVVVIGRRGRRIAAERALEYVFGYSVACDVTARDLQRLDGQWARAKGFDGFCPLGPCVTTGVDPASLPIELYVGDERRQAGNTREMLFDVPSVIAAVSSFATLEAGDVILTGTPAGVSALAPGDRVSVAVSGLEKLVFSVRREPGGPSASRRVD
jgi:2-keto-4-pentenoate hydratase/2-oxohepta-3-ene-1,7-dioic acid hydratase in catechol pathway